MIVLIDNYDSFTFNLVHYLGGLGADVVVHRNDKISVADVHGVGAGRDRAVARPLHAERSRHLPRPDRQGRAAEFRSSASASAIRRSARPSAARWCARRAGARQAVRDPHNGTGVFRGINGPFKATRYHSLVVERASMPRELIVTAETDDGLVMGLMHESLPVHGVQFHPESIASEHGHLMLKNFLDLAAEWNAAAASRAPQRHVERARSAEARHGRRFQGAHRQGRDRRKPDARGGGLRLRPHDVGRSDALADGRAC